MAQNNQVVSNARGTTRNERGDGNGDDRDVDAGAAVEGGGGRCSGVPGAGWSVRSRWRSLMGWRTATSRAQLKSASTRCRARPDERSLVEQVGEQKGFTAASLDFARVCFGDRRLVFRVLCGST